MTDQGTQRRLDLEDPFPLTPALSPRERETIGDAGSSAASWEYSQMGEGYSLSFGERVRVRGNSIPNCIDLATRCAPVPPPEQSCI
jgi:hypothetical protein